MKKYLYTSNAVAQWLGLTERRVRQLRDEGIIQETAPGLYDLRNAVIQYIKYLGGAGRENLNAERTRLTAAKRAAAEMDNAERRAELHDGKDIEKGLKTALLNLRSRLMVIPAKLSHELAQMGGNQAGIFDALKQAINEALEDLSHYDVTMRVQPEDPEDV